MDFTFATIAVISVMTFVLAGMVGFVYWRQITLLHQVDTLASALAGLMVKYQADHSVAAAKPPPPPATEEAPSEAPAEAPATEEAPTEEVAAEAPAEDDRLSVKQQDDTIEKVTGPPPATASASAAATEAIDVDSLITKTAPQLRQMLTERGIPFGKRDSKAALIDILKAMS